jgi:hypothetical protein
MNNKFDELTRQMAQSVTRRAALKKFGVGLAGIALAFFGASEAEAGKASCIPLNEFGCHFARAKGNSKCCPGLVCENTIVAAGICVPAL